MTLQRVDRDDGARILRASGELDVVVVPALLPSVTGLVDGVSAVVLDLTDVTFFDSSGVRLVDRLMRECARAGPGFRVVAPRGHPARRVLEIVGLAGSLVAEDLAAALEGALGAARTES
ncbi:MAG TPA: STAS domain-containing protein [Mycobacteriales bacterium]|nr:STAS domain-containing protein [Mycobacteriales bacterium]